MSRIIGITQGDPGSIGPEVALKALSKFLKLQKKGTYFLVFGHPNVLKKTAHKIKFKTPFKFHSTFNPKNLSKHHVNVLLPQWTLS